MANQEDIERAKQGKVVWNAWAKTHLQDVADFSKAKLDGIDFTGFVFRGRADFDGTTFHEDVSFKDAMFIEIAVFVENLTRHSCTRTTRRLA